MSPALSLHPINTIISFPQHDPVSSPFQLSQDKQQSNSDNELSSSSFYLLQLRDSLCEEIWPQKSFLDRKVLLMEMISLWKRFLPLACHPLSKSYFFQNIFFSFFLFSFTAFYALIMFFRFHLIFHLDFTRISNLLDPPYRFPIFKNKIVALCL